MSGTSIPIAAKTIQPFAQPLHFSAKPGMRQGRINLRRFYASVPQQFAYRLYSHSLRERNRRRKGMAAGVEGYGFADSRLFGHLLQTAIAPTVAGEREGVAGIPFGIALEDRTGQIEKTDINGRTGFLTVDRKPISSVVQTDTIRTELFHVDIGKAREAAEQKGVADEPPRLGSHRQPAQPADLVQRQVTAGDRPAVQFVACKGIAAETTACAGQTENMFQGDHVDPGRTFGSLALLEDEGMEAGEKFPVDRRKREIAAAAGFMHIANEQPEYAPILIIGVPTAAYAYHPKELLVVMTEKSEQLLLPCISTDILPLNHGCRNLFVVIAQRVVTPFDGTTHARQRLIDDCSLFAISPGASAFPVPVVGENMKPGRQQFALAANRNPA